MTLAARRALGTTLGGVPVLNGAKHDEGAAARAGEVVERHGMDDACDSYFTVARSILPFTNFLGPLAFGLMSKLKISVGT